MLTRLLRAPHGWLLALTLVLGAVLRLDGLTRQSLWTDELYAVWEARQSFARIFDPQIHIQHPPGYRLALHAWLGFGVAEWWVRLLPALAGLLLIPVVWALARELWPGRCLAAAAAALLTATSPFLLHYSQDATTYSWTILWVAASVYCLIRAWRTDRASWWAAWAGSLVVALYSHYFSLFPVALEVLAVGAGYRASWRAAGPACGGAAAGRPPARTGPGQGPGGRLLHAGLGLLAAAALYSPWVVVLVTRGGEAIGLQFFPLTVNTQIFHWVPTLVVGQAHDGFWQSRAGLLLVWVGLLAGAAWGGWRLRRARNGPAFRAILVAGAWAGAAILGPYLLLRVTEPPAAWHAVNFAAFAVPALLLVGGAFLAALPRRWAAAALALWLGLAAYQWQAELRAPTREDWRGLLQTIAATARPGDAWLAFPAFHAGAAAAYYPVPLAVQGGWFTPHGADPTGAAYWFPPGWTWQGWFDPHAELSTDWPGALAPHTATGQRLWYLAGDGVDGNYPPGPAAERALTGAGWQPAQEWRASPLVLRLYTRRAR